MKNNSVIPKTKAGKEREALAKAAAAVRVANKAARDAAAVLAKQSQMVPPMTKEEMEDVISKTVLKTLASVGIRVGDDDAVDEFRKDMEYTRAWRKTIQSTTKKGWLTFVTVSVTGILGVIVVGIRFFFTGHP